MVRNGKLLFIINMTFCLVASFAIKAFFDKHGVSWFFTIPMILLVNVAFCSGTLAIAMKIERDNRP